MLLILKKDAKLTSFFLSIFQELLNQECLSVIKGLQRDVEERSKKILKLELAGNRAKVVTHGERPILIETGEPRIEMSALIRGKSRRSQTASQSPSSSSTQTSTKSSELDLVSVAKTTVEFQTIVSDYLIKF